MFSFLYYETMSRNLEATLMREHMEVIHNTSELYLYRLYRNFDVGEIVNETFTLYGKMVAINALKCGGKPVFNYKKLTRQYFLEML